MGVCESCCRCDESSQEERVSLLHGEGGSGLGAREGGEGGGAGRSNDGADGFGGGSGGVGSSGSSGSRTGGGNGRWDKQSPEYFQSIIDDATNKFISSSSHGPRFANGGGGGNGGNASVAVQEMRSKLAMVTVNVASLTAGNSGDASSLVRLAAAPPSSSSLSGSSSLAGSASRFGYLQHQIVVDVLSEPVGSHIVSSQIEVAIDEIAELVATRAFAISFSQLDVVSKLNRDAPRA